MRVGLSVLVLLISSIGIGFEHNLGELHKPMRCGKDPISKNVAEKIRKNALDSGCITREHYDSLLELDRVVPICDNDEYLGSCSY